MTWELLKYLFGKLSSKNSSEGGILTKPELRKVVVKHPVEWDKNLNSKLDKEINKTDKEHLANKATAIDLWKGGARQDFHRKSIFLSFDIIY